MKLEKLYTKALAGERIAPDEALTLYEQAPLLNCAGLPTRCAAGAPIPRW